MATIARTSHAPYAAQIAAAKARKAHALTVGDHARNHGQISPAAHQLYEQLVYHANDKAYCWVGEERLAKALRWSSGTLKRRMAELVKAKLIQRQRRIHRTSLTYITAYLDPQAAPDAPQWESCPDQTEQRDSAHQPHEAHHDSPGSRSHDQQHPTTCDQKATPRHAGSGMGGSSDQTVPTDVTPNQESPAPVSAPVFDPTVGSDLIPHTFNTPNQENGGGSNSSISDLVGATPVTVALEAEQVVDSRALKTLQHDPIEEIQAVIDYVHTQPNIRSIPAMIVWLCRRKFGRHLVRQHRQARRGHHARRCSLPTTPQAYLSEAFCTHGIAGHCPICAGDLAPLPPAHGCNAAPPQEVPGDEAAVRQGDAEDVVPDLAFGTLWQAVLAHLDRATNEDAAWLGPTVLLRLKEGQAVVGTPNIFVREAVETRYKQQLEMALSHVSGLPTTIQVVIASDSSGCGSATQASARLRQRAMPGATARPIPGDLG